MSVVEAENVEEKYDIENENQDEEKSEKEIPQQKLRRFNSSDIESAYHSKPLGLGVILQLAFQSIGIVYGDIGTSPLYVYSSTFPNGIKNNDDIIGILSLILYTLTLIPLIKYVFIVLHATDNGDGGTFALYSLICRCAKVSLIPTQQAEDRDVSNYQLELPSDHRLRRASCLKSHLEKSRLAKYVLLLATMLGTSMLIGDGVFTPCISVLSAVGGIKNATSSMTEGTIVWISIAILIFLFMIQRFGTDKVGYSFAPILCIWFALNGVIGIYNFVKFDPTVIKAVNPWHIIAYFRRNKKEAWISLGGVVLCTTGSEALFADVGHFTVRSIQISTCAIVYPALLLAYGGQASYLREHNDEVLDTFYKSIPTPIYWPMFVISILAAIIASQSLISGTFSVIQQSLALGCFPRVKILHTSAKYEGQVYIAEVNYLLMLACIGVTLGFRTTAKIGNAYGIAVVSVMTLTSSFLMLIMVMIWKTNILLIIAYAIIIGGVELLYLSSVLYKFDQGGYLPLLFALILMTIMYVWNDVYRRRYYYELDQKISPERLKEAIAGTNFSRLPGLAIFYSELVHGIPPIFKHYLTNVPALHSVVIFLSVKSLHISKVPVEERFHFRRVEPKELNAFLCVVRYGYKEKRNDEQEHMEILLIERLKQFIREDFCLLSTNDSNGENPEQHEELGRDIAIINEAAQAGVVHLIGESEVVAGNGGSIMKRILINHAYNVLKRNLRQTDKVFNIPHKRLLKVGMTYEL